MDLLTSGAGGEVTDVSFRSSTAASKPFWTLTPLPLSHVRPGYTHARTSLPSLQSLALNAISTNFHLFSPSDFSTLAPHLKTRVLERLKGDRVYDLDAEKETHRPDEATLWAYQTLLDPTPLVEHTRSVTLGLPTAITLRHMAPNPTLAKPDHPLNEFPRLFRSIHAGADYTLLTSLTLGGLEGGVSDQTILSLRHCTHLSILKTRNCAISDDGIRMLSTALDLPGPSDDGEGKGKAKEAERGLGMWRLRAWYLQGCSRITDKSMQLFARWPGLVLLDVRDTSCTTAACLIFNRASRALFSCQNADFQSCTPGLLPLFATVATPRYLAEKLCILLGPPYTDTDPFSLHIVPSSREIRPEWLPPRSSTGLASSGNGGAPWTTGVSSVFRGDGVGQIYGSGVYRVHDQSRDFRRRVDTALFLTSRDEEEERDPRKRAKRLKEEREMWKSGWGTRAPPKPGKKDMDPYNRAASLVGGKKYRLKATDRDDIGPNTTHDHSRSAYAMRKIREGERAEEEKVKGDMELMLVRMVCSHWEELVWAADAGMELRRIAMGQAVADGPPGTLASQELLSQAAPTPNSHHAKVKALAGDALVMISAMKAKKGSTGSAFRPPQSSQRPRPPTSSSQMPMSSPRPVQNAAQPSSSPAPRPAQRSPQVSIPSSQPSQEADFQSSSPPPQSMTSSSPRAPKAANPFRANPFKSTANTSGVRPLSSSPFSSQTGNRPLAVKSEASSDPKAASNLDAFAGFTSSKKRSFSGTGGGEEGKRRGMKMFSGARM